MKIGYIGLGKMGKPAAEIISEYFYVEGFDIKNIETDKINLTNSYKELVKEKDIIFICAPTPHSDDYDGTKPVHDKLQKDFSYEHVKEILENINPFLTNNQVLVLVSTVLPGTIRNYLQYYVTNTELLYNPYIMCVDDIRQDFINPEIMALGNKNGIDDFYIQKLSEFYKTICGNNVKLFKGTWEEVECFKIYYNTFITTKVTFSNLVMDTTEKIGNSDPDKIINMLSECNKRIISKKYLKPGLGDGGPCHPRDNIALSSFSTKYDLGYDLFNELTYIREQQTKNIAFKIREYGDDICIMGKGYKTDSKITQGSQSILLAYYLEYLGCNVGFYDPNINIDESKGKNVFVLSWTDTDWVYQFSYPKNSIIFDPWRNFETERDDLKIVYYGKGF